MTYFGGYFKSSFRAVLLVLFPAFDLFIERSSISLSDERTNANAICRHKLPNLTDMSRKSGKGKFKTQIKICILQIKVRASLCWHRVNLSIEFHVLLHERAKNWCCGALRIFIWGPPNGTLDRVALPPANFSGTFSYNPSLFFRRFFSCSGK